MRATVAIDDHLLEEAFRLSKLKTKRQLIDASLREFVRKKRLEHLATLYGSEAVTLTCEDLEEYRARE